MNVLVFYSLILLSLVRISGMLVALSFYMDFRKPRYLLLSIGWLFLSSASIAPILGNINTLIQFSDIFLALNGLFASLGVYFLALGIIMEIYLMRPKMYLTPPFFFLILTLVIFSLFGYQLSVLINMVIFYTISLSIFGIPLLYLEKMKDFLGTSVKWYFFVLVIAIIMLFIIIIVMFSGEGYGLYNSDNELLILPNYTISIIAHVFVIILIINIENNFFYRDKILLKDKYSHDLGNITQVVQSAASLIIVDNQEEEEKLKKVELIKKKCKEASNLIKEIRKL